MGAIMAKLSRDRRLLTLEVGFQPQHGSREALGLSLRPVGTCRGLLYPAILDFAWLFGLSGLSRVQNMWAHD
jgi:hypothetical protein